MHRNRPAVILIILLTSLLASEASAQMRIASDRPEQLEATMVVTRPARGAEAMPLVNERLQVTIDNQHATTTLKQTYHNRSRAVVEGRYKLRAGIDSRVEGFAYWNGEQKIVGEVFEKEVARGVYEQVTRRRRDPGLLEQTADGSFTFQVFPIQPDEQKRVEVSYTRWLTRNGRSIRYRAPVSSESADIVVDIMSERSVKDVRSSSHAVTVDPLRGGGVRIRARSRGEVSAFELSYELEEPAWSVSAFVHKDPEHDGYFVASLAAPANLANKVAAKDVTIVLDRSGSMAGQPLAQAKAAAADIIRRLDGRDRVNVVAFDDDVDPLFDQPTAVSKTTRERAIRYVEELDAGGGTDLALALETSLAAQADTVRPQVVLFLTDGQSDARRTIEAASADERDIRVFAVGLGEGVNKSLLSRLARLKRGQFAYIENTGDIERNIGLVYRQISRPLLIDVSFDVVGAVTERKVYPRTIGDLFVDDELVVSGRLRGGAGPVTFIVRGQLDGKKVEFKRQIKLASQTRRPWVGRQWAQARVAHLLEDLDLDGEQVEKKEEVIELALAYNFVTRFTSFLAIPANEATGDARRALDDARARKLEVLRKHADALALADPAPARVASRADSFGDDDDDDDSDDGDDGDDGESEPVRGESLAAHPGSARKKSGCAGCSSSGTSGLGGLAVLLGLALLCCRRRDSAVATRPRRSSIIGG